MGNYECGACSGTGEVSVPEKRLCADCAGTGVPHEGKPPKQDRGDLWVCGQHRAKTTDGIVWDFQGIFSSRELAIAACKNRMYFIGPVSLDNPFQDARCEWPGVFYPLAKQVKETQ